MLANKFLLLANKTEITNIVESKKDILNKISELRNIRPFRKPTSRLKPDWSCFNDSQIPSLSAARREQ